MKLLDFERVASNYFSPFFQSIDPQEFEEYEEYSEIRFVQNKFKQKIEITDRSYFGYVFQSLEFKQELWTTSVNTVQTFSFFEWRAMDMIDSRQITFVDLPVDKLKELSFAQLPSGKTLMHLVAENKSGAEYLLKIFGVDDDPTSQPFYLPVYEDRNGLTVLDYLFDDSIRVME